MHNPGELDWGPISRVEQGMQVVDVDGQDVGSVEFVQMSDPEATTTAGNEPREPAGLAHIAGVLGGDEREPDVPEPLRSRLRRSGFVKIDGPDLRDTDRYVSSEHIGEVSDEQ